jgi:IS6 family transposase
MIANTFKRHRFPPAIILLAVCWYCRYPLSYQGLRDLFAERSLHVDPSTINRWVVKFGPELARCTRKLHYPRSMLWHVEQTYIRVSSKWRYLWRIEDQNGRFVDFRLTAKRDSKAAKAFLQQAQRNCRLYPPATIVTDKAPTYPTIIQSIGTHAYYNEPVKHINQKWRNNRIESDHAALKWIISPSKGFHSLSTAKATLIGVEAFRIIKRGDIFKPTTHAVCRGTSAQWDVWHSSLRNNEIDSISIYSTAQIWARHTQYTTNKPGAARPRAGMTDTTYPARPNDWARQKNVR